MVAAPAAVERCAMRRRDDLARPLPEPRDLSPGRRRCSASCCSCPGEQGWNAQLSRSAQLLASQGALVAGIDSRALFANLESDGAECVYPDGDLENLSHFLQAYYRLAELRAGGARRLMAQVRRSATRCSRRPRRRPSQAASRSTSVRNSDCASACAKRERCVSRSEEARALLDARQSSKRRGSCCRRSCRRLRQSVTQRFASATPRVNSSC